MAPLQQKRNAYKIAKHQFIELSTQDDAWISCLNAHPERLPRLFAEFPDFGCGWDIGAPFPERRKKSGFPLDSGGNLC